MDLMPALETAAAKIVELEKVRDVQQQIIDGLHRENRKDRAELDAALARVAELEKVRAVVEDFMAEHETFDAATRWGPRIRAALDAVPAAETTSGGRYDRPIGEHEGGVLDTAP